MTICAGFESYRASPADVRVITSDGQSMAAHSYVLVSQLPALLRSVCLPAEFGPDLALNDPWLTGNLAAISAGLVVAGAGADDRRRTARVGRRVHRPRPGRLRRRRPRVRPFPLLLQGSARGGGGGGGRARGAAAGPGARVQGRVAEARGGGGRVGAADAGPRGRHAEAGEALRRAEAVPAVRAARGQGLRRRRALRRVALRAPPRRRAGAGAPQADGGRRPAEAAVGAGEGRAGGVPAARRRHVLPGPHLPLRRRRRLPHGRAAVRDGGVHVPGPAAADAPLRDVRQEGRAGRLRAVQAHAAALPPPRLRLRPDGPDHLPCAALQPFQIQGAGGESGQDMATSGQEGH